MQTFTLYGTDSKVGVTMTAQAVAESYALMYPKQKVIIMHLDGNPGFEYCLEGQGIGLDDIKAALISKILKGTELESACSRTANLYQLKGVENYSKRKEYYPEHVKQILDLLDFDLCIIDAGSNFELGLTIGSLLYSNHNYLVTTQQQVPLNRYTNISEQVLIKLGIEFELLILNKQINSLKLDHENNMKVKYEVNQSVLVPMLDYGWQAEAERESLLHFKNESYRRSIDSIAKIIAYTAGYENIEAPKSFFKRFIGG